MTTVASYRFLESINPLSLTHLSWTTTFNSIQEMAAHSSRGQFVFLAEITAELLMWELKPRGEGEAVEKSLDLTSMLQELTLYVERQKTYSLLKSLLSKAERLETIDTYYGQLTTHTFQFVVFERLENPFPKWKDSFDQARKLDQDALNRYLTGLVDNQRSMVRELGFDGTNAVPTIACLQRYISNKSADEQEICVLNTAISYISLSTLEDRVVDLKPWMITTFEVDVGPLIGAGSLGKVFRGRWNGKDVAIKMLKTGSNITPRLVYVNHEMKAWSKLHHPNVLSFLGGNTLDNNPFLVIPFLKHRTCRDFIQKHPGCNRLRLLYETSLGLSYLHSRNIIHGNLNGSNILVNDAEKAQVCDYGLAEIKADINSRSPLEPASLHCMRSQNWMAPELLSRGSLTFQCDIYSFGMTMYEIFTDHIPLGDIPLGSLYKIVVEKGVRPERPRANEAAQFSDEAWGLAVKCWAKNPTNRIDLSKLTERLAALLPSCKCCP